MKSVYIRELRRYTKLELSNLFPEINSNQLTVFIRKLRAYGVLRSVKRVSGNLDLSELVSLDKSLIDGIDDSNFSYYLFNYVGVIYIDGYLLCCYPKYLFAYDSIEDKSSCRNLLKQVLKVLHRYNTNSQSIQLYVEDDQSSPVSRMSMIIALLDDYFQNGLYFNTQNIHELNGDGEINWNRTINFIHPLWQEEDPYYLNFWTRRNTIDDKSFIQRIHECLLTICSRELEEISLLDLLDINGVYLTELSLSDLGTRDYLLYRITNELNLEFNSRKQYVLKLMVALLKDSSSMIGADNIDLFGTTSFNLVWETVCAEVFDNKLTNLLSDLPLLSTVKIPPNMLAVKPRTLKDLIEHPMWTSKDGTTVFSDTLKPDLISVERNENVCSFVILDAKYYTMSIESNKVEGQPGVGDVTKQYLYQLAYKDFIELNGIEEVKNCFLMPTEKDEIVSVGNVQMEILGKLGLEKIQVRELPAARMFECYLQRRKMPISVLNL
ncbi:LlaJI family restriction endonuclease [uncultured Veillonella sp.]|uniref:LlaJI family restriction endonuclease n=1 Tax=uncultured Veillonella sp. TaxID=159268 RepID=UPI00260E2180|nr:LlaJI family restriction endonuclease [uncultured Veillonella sp.]